MGLPQQDASPPTTNERGVLGRGVSAGACHRFSCGAAPQHMAGFVAQAAAVRRRVKRGKPICPRAQRGGADRTARKGKCGSLCRPCWRVEHRCRRLAVGAQAVPAGTAGMRGGHGPDPWRGHARRASLRRQQPNGGACLLLGWHSTPARQQAFILAGTRRATARLAGSAGACQRHVRAVASRPRRDACQATHCGAPASVHAQRWRLGLQRQIRRRRRRMTDCATHCESMVIVSATPPFLCPSMFL